MVNSPPKDSGKKLFYGLFIFPLLIAVGMAVLLCTVVLLTRESETPESLITAIKTGSPTKRWQKAFELSNELNQGRGLIREAGVMKEVIHILGERSEYDAKTRSYMALALAKFEGPEVTEALRAALTQEKETEVIINILWALGVKRDTAAIDLILPFLGREEEALKKTAVYVLGAMGDIKTTSALEPLLEDPSQDVRWNAALALARLGNSAGYETLVKMTDRETLKATAGLSEEQTEEIIVNAVKGLGILARPESGELLLELAEADPSLKVRQAAIESLDQTKLR